MFTKVEGSETFKSRIPTAHKNIVEAAASLSEQGKPGNALRMRKSGQISRGTPSSRRRVHPSKNEGERGRSERSQARTIT